MTPETLAIIKSDLSKLKVVAKSLADAISFPVLQVLSVLIHNASCNHIGSYNYIHADSESKLYKIHLAIEEIARYEKASWCTKFW